jgi:diguanylate cyclase (GGDEF)-like protein/PAS domain S-box-containing protein
MSEFKRTLIPAMAAIMASLASLGALGWTLAAGATDRAWYWLLIGLAVASGLAALVFVWRSPKFLLKTLRPITSALNRAAEGDFETALDARQPSELKELIVALDSMRKRLRSSTISRDYLDRLLASMNEAILVTDAEGVIQRTNAAAREMLDRDDAQLIGAPIDTFIGEDGSQSLRILPRNRPREGVFRRRGGATVCISYTVSELRDERGGLQSLVYAAQNIDDRKRVEQRIRYLARTDALTKIANRMQFQHLLQQNTARAKRAHKYLALLYLDVDRFKDINDTFGHAAGDTSLEMFSRRIVEVIPEHAIAGRLAGDEFAVSIGDLSDMEQVMSTVTELARRILHVVGKTFLVQNEEVFMTTSIGVAIYPRDADNAVDLLRNADAALYQAKKAGGNCFEFYSPDLHTAAEERLTLKSKLRRAFEREELRLHYQPKYSLKSGRIEGAEGLVRWDLPDRGLVFPSDFIPLAEETNFILQIGDWVLNQVCADYREWQRFVPSPCRVSVNLSLRQLQQQRFLEGVRNTFRAHGIAPSCLELEITETTLMEDTERTIRILDALYGMGLHLAIDDFGTGYSSLSALQQFPISTLKIDQSFVRDLAIDRDNASIVKTIIQMAHSLKLEVVAEGVESQEQLDFLRAQGCHYAQGHLFGDPVTGDEFRDLLIADADGSGRYRALFA